MSAIKIVGLDHFLQSLKDQCFTEAGKKEEARQKQDLANILDQIIKENEIDLIAEEGKLDGSCLGSLLAKENNVSHIDITMPVPEREKRGVRTPDYDNNDASRRAAYQIFEQYMFERLGAADWHKALVMVGRRHLGGLTNLLEAAGHEVATYDVNDYDWYKGIPQEGADGIVGYFRED